MDVNIGANSTYEEFIQRCKPFGPFLPTVSGSPCKAYEIPGGVLLPQVMLRSYYETTMLEARESDILVASYPKTGATLVQEICNILLNLSSVSKSNVESSKSNESSRTSNQFYFLESPTNCRKSFERMESPRLLKTHLPHSILPPDLIQKKCKIVYVCRNPKDTVLSYYKFYTKTNFLGYSGTLEQFLEMFLDSKVLYSSFASNVLEYWKQRENSNILFITYEEMHKDLLRCIKTIADFMGISVTTAQITSAASTMCQAVNKEISDVPKGSIGEWNKDFDSEMNSSVDAYIEKNFQGSGLQFTYEV